MAHTDVPQILDFIFEMEKNEIEQNDKVLLTSIFSFEKIFFKTYMFKVDIRVQLGSFFQG